MGWFQVCDGCHRNSYHVIRLLCKSCYVIASRKNILKKPELWVELSLGKKHKSSRKKRLCGACNTMSYHYAKGLCGGCYSSIAKLNLLNRPEEWHRVGSERLGRVERKKNRQNLYGEDIRCSLCGFILGVFSVEFKGDPYKAKCQSCMHLLKMKKRAENIRKEFSGLVDVMCEESFDKIQSDTQRMAIKILFKGYTYREAAKVLGVSSQTVMGYKRSVKRTLKNNIA